MRRARKFLRILASPSFAHALFRHGVAATTEHLNMLRSIEAAQVLDVGANRGQFALAARQAFPRARIDCFEPIPDAVRTLDAVFRGDTRVRVHACAIGSTAGKMHMHISLREDSSSLLPISAQQTRVFPGTGESSSITVSVDTLQNRVTTSELIHPTLLKVDVQGFELQVLEGAGSLLPHIDYVYCECSYIELYSDQSLADEVIDFLRAHQLLLVGVYNTTYDSRGIAVQSDLLFGRR